jgi:hypothetical protein
VEVHGGGEHGILVCKDVHKDDTQGGRCLSRVGVEDKGHGRYGCMQGNVSGYMADIEAECVDEGGARNGWFVAH